MKKTFFITAIISLLSMFAYAQTTTVTKLHTVENPATSWLDLEMEQGEVIDIQFDYSGFNNITGMHVEFTDNWGATTMGTIEIPEAVGTNEGTINTTVTVPETAIIHTDFEGTGLNQLIKIIIYHGDALQQYVHNFGDDVYATIKIKKGEVPVPEVTVTKLHTVENPTTSWLNLEMKQGEEIDIQFEYSGFNNITGMNIEFGDNWGATAMGNIEIVEAVGTNEGTVNKTVTVPETAIVHKDFGGAGDFQIIKLLIYHNNGAQYAHNFGGDVYATIKINKADVAVSAINVTPNTATISINGNVDLDAVFTPTDATNQNSTWSSDNEGVATVDTNTGVVTGVSAGNAVITATSEDGNFTATCNITVSDENFSVESISLDYKTREVDNNATQTLNATILPSNATNKKIIWESSDENVATVADGVVTYVANGTASISATTEDGSFSDTCVITSVDTAYFYFDDINKYITPSAHKTNSNLEVSVNYSMGANNVINNDDIKFCIRQMSSTGNALNIDYNATNANTYAGTSKGVATENIDLTGATLTADLPAGGWYWMWISCKDNKNKLYEATTEWMANVILIVDENSASLKVVENRTTVYPNPAENNIYIEGIEGNSEATIYTIDGKLVKNTILGLGRRIDVSSLSSGTYVLQVKDEIGFNVQLINIK